MSDLYTVVMDEWTGGWYIEGCDGYRYGPYQSAMEAVQDGEWMYE